MLLSKNFYNTYLDICLGILIWHALIGLWKNLKTPIRISLTDVRLTKVYTSRGVASNSVAEGKVSSPQISKPPGKGEKGGNVIQYRGK